MLLWKNFKSKKDKPSALTTCSYEASGQEIFSFHRWGDEGSQGL